MDVRNILQTTLGAESGLTPGLSFAQRINQALKAWVVKRLLCQNGKTCVHRQALMRHGIKPDLLKSL